MFTFLGIAGGLYLLICVLMYAFQESLIFFGNPMPALTPIQLPPELRAEEVFWDNGEARLHGLHFRVDDPKGVILYFHGNAGNVMDWAGVAIPFLQRGYEVILPDYRGYGKSQGKRSQAALLEDAEVQYRYAAGLYGEDSLILYGRSLGSGFATYLASHNRPSRLILETPYYSIRHLSQEKYPWLPVGPLLRYPLPSYRYVPEVTSPVSIIHGDADQLIPVGHSHRLIKLLPDAQISYTEVPDGGHNDLATFPAYATFLDQNLP